MKIKNHPFPFLLYLEWILLGVTILTEIPWYLIFPPLQAIVGVTTNNSIPFLWQFNIICITIFGLLGLGLPTTSNRKKWIYIGLQFLIIIIVNGFNRWYPFSTPYLIILMRSCLILPTRQRFIVGGLSFLCSIYPIILSSDVKVLREELVQFNSLSSQEMNVALIYSIFTATFYFGLVLVFVLMLINALIKERQSRQNLAIAHEQLRQYAQRIEDQATLEERNRIARDIHDSLGHALTAQSIQLESALLFCHTDTNKTEKYLTISRKLAIEALEEIRKSVSSLRNEPMQKQPIGKSIKFLSDDFSKNTNIQVNFSINFDYPLPTDINIAIYRIIQEALTNITKHSKATKVEIILAIQPEEIHLQIEDNGQGFNPQQNTTGFGHQTMRDRSSSLGGNLEIISAVNQGCKVIVDIPLPKFLLSSSNR